MVSNTRKLKAQKPKRSYRAVIESLRQVWRIEEVVDKSSIWQIGKPEVEEFRNVPLRVTIWNLCKGAGGRLFEHDYRVISYQSDLILTQEALLSERGLQTFGTSGFEAVHAASYKRRDGLRDGVMTASRCGHLPILKRIVCKYPEPIFRTPKVALVTMYKLANHVEPLMVVNIHATLVRRVAGAVEEIEHVVSQLPQHKGPIMFAGDFNTFTPRYLADVSRALRTIGLELVPIPNDPRPTIGALDQVFVRGLNVNQIFVDTKIKNSDHFPLCLEISPILQKIS